MFGKLDVQKELDNLARDEQNLRNRYGRKFSSLYNSVINSMTNNRRIIEQAQVANTKLDVELVEVVNALQVIDYEV